NTADADGRDPNGNPVNASDSATADGPTPAPALALDKALIGNLDEDGSGNVTLGDTLTYGLVATNTGNITLTDVTIVDPMLGALVAIIAGHAARRDIRASRGLDTGAGLALAGLILGWTQAALILLAFLGWIVALAVASLFGGFALLVLILLGLVFLAGLLGLVSMFGFVLG
ncbi:MAG: DUF4190 domain-containing protein, partial [Wenzhouxiangellaceae bacterium]